MRSSRSRIGGPSSFASEIACNAIRSAALAGLVLAALQLAGCGGSRSASGPMIPPTLPSSSEPNSCKGTRLTGPQQPAPSANFAAAGFSGFVRAGTVPMIAASVQLYAAGTTGKGSSPTALLPAPITTDANGAFTVAPNITCPFSNSVLYVISRGGHAGVSGPGNAGAVLAGVLGACSALKSSQAVVVDEATTVAAAWAMGQFLSAGARIGATATNSSGILLAAATAASLVDPGSGTAPGATFPATATAPIAKIDTLANALNACVTSESSSGACTQLYAAGNASGSPSGNTLDATWNIVRHPGTNVAQTFAAAGGSAAYTPALTGTPPDWTLSVSIGGGGLSQPTSLSIDSQGNVWVANYGGVASRFSNTGVPQFPVGIVGNGLLNSYGGAVDVTDTMWIANEQSASDVNSGNGSLTVLSSGGTVSGSYVSGGLNFPVAVAFDPSGVAWVVDYGNSHISLLDESGHPLSGNGGYTSSSLDFPVAVATDSRCNAYVANNSSNTVSRVLADGSEFEDFVVGNGPAGVALDPADNVWVANFHDSSVALVSASGSLLSGAGFTASSLNQPQAIAVDGNGDVWVASYRGPALSELAGATSATPGAFLSPSAGWGPDARLVEPYALAIDASGNIWVSNYGNSTLTEYIGLAAPVKTPLLGPVRIP